MAILIIIAVLFQNRHTVHTIH